MLLGRRLKAQEDHRMNNVKKIEKEIYNHKKGIGKVEWGSWWDNELYAYLESFRLKKIRQWYNMYLKNKDCLVLGCGSGEDIEDFEGLANKIVGIDISKRQILKASIKFKKHDFIVCDAENLPFRDGSYDVIFCKSILHHLPNITKAITETNRVLRQSGILFIAYEPCLLNLIATIGRKFFPSNIHTPSEKPFIPFKLRKLLKNGGFIEKQVDYFYLFSHIFPITIIRKSFGLKFLKFVIRITMSLERSLKDSPFKNFYWIITGIYGKINTL
jgi:ubiquinone/menaquinone biosynthesis C-methylase UbiE